MSAQPNINDYLAKLGGAQVGIEGDAAGVVRQYVVDVREYLIGLHEAGASGHAVNEAHSDLMDRLVRRLFAFAEESYFADGGEASTELCVVAVGGYARREMNLFSDVDLLFLHRDELTPYVASVAERVQYWLWDAALTVGGATRTVAETLVLAREDMTVRTAVLAPRFLVGSGVLFHDFAGAVQAELFPDPEAFVNEQIEAQRERHARFGESLYLLQPNVKEGEGGLRDFHVAYWTMQATQPTARGRDDFLHLGLLTEEETGEYHEALDFLWRVRNELHRIAGRKNDRMSFEHQEKIARAFGYSESPETSELPVERFMGAYYRHARAVRNYSSLVIEQCQSRVRRAPRKREVEQVEGRLRIANGQLEIPHTRHLREQPLQLLDAFAVAQDHSVPLTRKAQRLVRENLYLIDDAFRASPEARDIFLRILDNERRVMRSLMAMNEVGLLAAYLPEWEHIVCRWQQVMYHTYTVDVHSIFLVEELRRLWRGKYERALPELSTLVRSVEDRPVLFLGCLLHDIGKGLGGDHSDKGVVRAKTCLERLGLEPQRIERVLFLVQHHLLMSHLAQTRDLSDPKLMVEFARTVGDRINLRNLYLLTFADIRASSTSAWTEWKGRLLRELFERTSEFLETGSDDPNRAMEMLERQVERRRDSSSGELRGLGVADTNIQAFFDMMPQRYFTAHIPRQIARHAMVTLALQPGQALATAIREGRDGSSEFILCTKDRHGLYADVSGVLSAHAINILGAHVYTTRSGLALEIYRVTTPAGGDGERALGWEEFERSLRMVIEDAKPVGELLRRRGRRLGASSAPTTRPVRVTISNTESDFYTIADVVGNDRLGLLHDLTRAIADCGVEVYISKAAMILDQVTDTFYLKDSEGKKLQDPALIESLRHSLQLAAERDGEGGAG